MSASILLPAAATRPAEIYAIGDFNSWQIPEGEQYNGALPMAPAEGSEDYYWEDLRIPAGTEALMFYYRDADTGEDVFLGSDLPPFTLYKFAGSVSGVCTSGTLREEVSPIRLRDWRGSRIMGGLYADSRKFSMASFDGPTFPNPAPNDVMYALVSVDADAPVAIALDDEEYDPYFWTLTFGTDDTRLSEALTGAAEVSILFSADPEAMPQDCWGMASEGADPEAPEAVVTEFVKGGEAFRFILPADNPDACFSVSASFSTGLAYVTGTGDTTGVPHMDCPDGMADIYYDLTGKKVTYPLPGGIYLRIRGGKIEKTINLGR